MKITGTSYPTILALAFPALVQGLLATVVMITDRIILAEYSETALGSMQISGPVGWIGSSLFGAFAVGVGSFIGRSWGADNHKAACEYLGSGLAMSLVMGIFLATLGTIFTPELCNFMVDTNKTSLELREMAGVYLYYFFPAAPLLVMSSSLVGGHQAIGNTKWPMYTTLVAGLVNLGVSVVLVHGLFGLPRLGVEGAAIGTVTCYAIGFLIHIAPYLRQIYPLKIHRPRWIRMKAIAHLSAPAFGERSMYHGAYLVFCAFIGHLGDTAMSVHQGLIALESLGFISASAFGIAAFTLSAQHLGADAPEKALLSVKRTMYMGICTLTVFGLILWIAAPILMSFFVKTESSIALGAACLAIAAIAQPLMVTVEIWSGAFRGAGDTKTPMVGAILGPALIRLTACWYLAFELEMGLVGIWLGSTFDWVGRTIFFIWHATRGRWLTHDSESIS